MKVPVEKEIIEPNIKNYCRKYKLWCGNLNNIVTK